MNATTSKPRRPNRICGVFVTAAKRNHQGPKIREGQYFPSTRAASRYLGFKSDIVAKNILLSWYDGCGVVGGIWFKTAKQMYKDAQPGSASGHYNWLVKQFPFIKERRVIFNDRPRWSKRRARMLDLPYRPKPPAPEPEYQI